MLKIHIYDEKNAKFILYGYDNSDDAITYNFMYNKYTFNCTNTLFKM